MTRESHGRKHSSVLLRFTFKIHRNLFYMDYIWHVVNSSCRNGRTGNVDFFFSSNLGTSNLLRPQHVHSENPPLSCQADSASLSQDNRAARPWLPGLVDMPTTSLLESPTFWLSGSLCLIHLCAHKGSFRSTWIFPVTPPSRNKQHEENWWSKDSFWSKLMSPSECTWLVGKGQV